MAGEVFTTTVGNLTEDPILTYTQGGVAVVNVTIASTARRFDKASNDWVDEESLFLRGSVWRDYAEHVAASLKKGMRVIATGKLKQRSYETTSGEKRTVIEMDIDELAPSLRYATAVVERTQGSQTQQNNRDAAWQQQADGYPPIADPNDLPF